MTPVLKSNPRRPKWLIVASNIGDNFVQRVRLAAGRTDSRDGSTHLRWPLERSVEYIDRVFGDYLAYGNLTAGELAGKRVLEIGPGDNLGVALRFLAAGAKEVVCLDKYYSHRDEEQQRRIYRALRERLPAAERDAFDQAISFSESGYQFNTERLSYVHGVAVEDSEATLAAGSFDLIVSRAVLYEIYEIDAAFAAMHRALAPGGRMIHKVYFQDWMFPQNNHHPLEFLTIPDGIYKMMAGHSGKCCRRMIDYYRGKMRELGYETEFHIARIIGMKGPDFPPNTWYLSSGEHYPPETLELVREIRPRLIPRFQKLPDEELMLEDVFLVARKP